MNKLFSPPFICIQQIGKVTICLNHVPKSNCSSGGFFFFEEKNIQTLTTHYLLSPSVIDTIMPLSLCFQESSTSQFQLFCHFCTIFSFLESVLCSGRLVKVPIRNQLHSLLLLLCQENKNKLS